MAISQGILRMQRLGASEGTPDDTPEPLELSQVGYYSAAWCTIFLGLAGVNCLFQILWFWRVTGHNINMDAISYIGIARHLADGDFHASLHGYWSPLLSWCIAGVSALSPDFLLAGRIVTIASFLLCLPLLYLLTLRLWSSPTLAALSVLCFTLFRGVAAFSVFFIGADFILTASVLCYFILLLRCLRNPTPVHWLTLGIAHAAAFLVKAFAMPLLTIPTILAALSAGRRNPKHVVVSAVAGMVIPVLVWGSWGELLKVKYGQFTPGYQAKYNLLDPETKKSVQGGGLTVLDSTSNTYDRYMVVDSMYPGSPLWNAHLNARKAISQILHKELKTLPQAFKQIIILATPGGILAFFLALRYLSGTHAILAWITALTSILLIVGYCMLVFDERYVLPLAPLLIAFAVPFLVPSSRILGNRSWSRLAGGLFVLSLIFLTFYRASPFRSLRRDYQTSVYSAAASLQKLPSCNKLVAIGEGPFPEHGVGWEAGIYASYFAQCRLVGFSDEIPSAQKTSAVLADLQTLQPDSILLFGNPQDVKYELLLNAIRGEGYYSASALEDREVGEIGQLLSK